MRTPGHIRGPRMAPAGAEDPIMPRLSHYEILEQIAEGGMGVVYKARDLNLGRVVALKLLSPSIEASQADVERLFEEARAISRLNHPNVATIYEVDQKADEPFMALEYLPGGTLRDKIREFRNGGGSLPIADVLRYAEQMSRGLAHAHRHGIVHRDVKSENALLDEEGVLKLADFGVALVAGRRLSGADDASAGTAAYMSPEQAQGGEVDHRSDIFSFGVVLFEMIAGTVPYAGQAEAAMLYDIVHTPAPRLRELRDDVPAGLSKIAEKALAKHPAERYFSMDDVLKDLLAVQKDLQAERGDMRSGEAPPPAQPSPDPTIAVLPFVNMSSDNDQEYFCDGVTEEIINALTTIKGLKVVSRTSSFRFKGQAYDIREIGKQLGVQTVLEGSVRRIGNRFRITAQHINVADGYHLWSRRFDREMEDVFAVQDEIAQSIVATLRVNLAGAEREPIVKKPTASLTAYNHYLQGRYHLNQRTEESIRRAIASFEQAHCDDCSYALPCAGLAEAHMLLGVGGYAETDEGEALTKAKQAATHAVEADPNCAEAHIALALVSFRKDWDWETAEAEFRRGIALNDGYATGHHQFAMFLAILCRLDEALREIDRALELDPLSVIISTARGRILHFMGRYDEAIEQFERTITLNPQFAGVYFDLSVSCATKGMYPEALAAAREMGRLSGGQIREWTLEALIHGGMGEQDKARAAVRKVEEFSKTHDIQRMTRGFLRVAMGDLDRAFDDLEEACERHEAGLVYLQCEPSFAVLRSDPRYESLARKIGFPPIPAR